MNIKLPTIIGTLLVAAALPLGCASSNRDTRATTDGTTSDSTSSTGRGPSSDHVNSKPDPGQPTGDDTSGSGTDNSNPQR